MSHLSIVVLCLVCVCFAMHCFLHFSSCPHSLFCVSLFLHLSVLDCPSVGTTSFLGSGSAVLGTEVSVEQEDAVPHPNKYDPAVLWTEYLCPPKATCGSPVHNVLILGSGARRKSLRLEGGASCVDEPPFNAETRAPESEPSPSTTSAGLRDPFSLQTWEKSVSMWSHQCVVLV